MTHAAVPNAPLPNITPTPNTNTNPNPTADTNLPQAAQGGFASAAEQPAVVPVQDGPMAAVTAALRLAEQVLFVFVASLWPNAVGNEGVEGMGVEEDAEEENLGNEVEDGMLVQ